MLGGLLSAVLGLLHLLGVGLPLLTALAVVFSLVALVAPWVAIGWLEALALQVRTRSWAAQQGRFHSFAGVSLEVEDDGRHVWLGARGLQQVLGRRESEEVLAARHAGRWRRAGRERSLQLRADAVVSWLSTMPGRDDPHVQRLRRYIERDLLYPAQQRQQRGHAR